MRGPALAQAHAGLTLVELAVAIALVAVLAGLAAPHWLAPLVQARRSDAVAALTHLHSQQERHRIVHGLYAADPAALPGVAASSASGWYDIHWQRPDPWRFEATATARPNGPQARDAQCSPLTLSVNDGLAEQGPSARCWGR
jgi:type IV pilus assembly protein PilE